jgi:hypothetical protein
MHKRLGLGVMVLVSNTTFNNICSHIVGSVLFGEETGVPGEKHRKIYVA